MPADTPINPPGTELDTRSRILLAGLRLFRKHGYHGVGINEILDFAQAPKGSMYHHFPGGKEEIAVAVIQKLSQDILGMLAASRARSTPALLLQVGAQLTTVMQKTNHEVCALFSGFVSERNGSPLLGQAVSQAYDEMIARLSTRLQADGLAKRAAHERAVIVIALLEGGALLAQAQQSTAPFDLAVKQSAKLCSDLA
jgi:TetR/AcrR family transcriptional regulator, lmrAB and yxaGH operons repressor